MTRVETTIRSVHDSDLLVKERLVPVSATGFSKVVLGDTDCAIDVQRRSSLPPINNVRRPRKKNKP